MLGSDYYWLQLKFYNVRLLLNKDQEIKVFHLVSGAYSIAAWGDRLKLNWVVILNCWDTIAIISTACWPACLFV